MSNRSESSSKWAREHPYDPEWFQFVADHAGDVVFESHVLILALCALEARVAELEHRLWANI